MKVIRTTILSAACLVGLALILTASPAAADQVILDDLIVDGSLCVGFDCVNGESFGFDTIRLKENNLRIDFKDTSTAASFPPNDWAIVINDSANGGASYFGVEDRSAGRMPFRVLAGARANALVVDAQGDIGIGTLTPTVDIHVKTGDTPTLRLEQDGTSGFAPQTWDVAGNETNFFIRDVSNGSALPIRSRPGAPTSSIDVASSGDVGFGTSSPQSAVHVQRADGENVGLLLDNNDAAAPDGWELRVNTNGNFQITENNSGVQEFQISSAGAITTSGNLTVGGTLSKGAGAFKIDHPLDPENRYLQHSFVESPDMMNIYNGNLELDDQGRGVVELPEWFAALNNNYRYQLTAIGAPAPSLHVARQFDDDNAFEIAGGQPGLMVSWQVTGVRADAFAEANRIQVETLKDAEDRGSYLHPEAFGQPKDRRVGVDR